MAYYRGITKCCTFPTELRIITSILPRASREKRDAEERACRAWRERVAGRPAGRPGPCTRPRTDKRQRVRGGCLGAEGRRRTRRPAKRSGGAACERRALRLPMGQPVQRDGWTPPAEPIGRGRAVGELKHLSSPTNRNQTRFPS